MQKLSIIIPAYNEQATIEEVLKRVLRENVPHVKKEVIVVNDGSSDGTRTILEKVKKKEKSVHILHHENNRGKGAAIRTGIEHSSGDFILIQDADMEYDPKEYPKILAPLLSGKAKVVYGSRIAAIEANLKSMYLTHYFGNRFLSFMTSLLYGQYVSDMETGYKAFRREVVVGMILKSWRFDIEPEITAKILKRGHRILEVPIGFEGRTFKEGKKITWVDGLIALWTLIMYRFVD